MTNEISKKNETNNITASGNISAVAGNEKSSYSDVSVKALIAEEEVQEAMRRCVAVPKVIIIKQLKNPYRNKDTNTVTQKISAMSGTTLEDAVSLELTLIDIELDPKNSINKKYRIIDYKLALEANMSGGNFNGYAATGLKLTVTKLEEVK